jgi:phosphoserine phosphatase RsbU/P
MFSFEQLLLGMNSQPSQLHSMTVAQRTKSMTYTGSEIGLWFASIAAMQSLAIHSERRGCPALGRVLVADDQPHVLTALEILLNSQGYQTRTACDPASVLSALEQEKFDVVVMDLNYTRDTTGGGEGLGLMSQIHSLDETVPLIVMTAWGSVELAVEAMRGGASDFVQKPWNNHTLLEKVREQVEQCRALRSLRRRKEEEESEAREIQQSLLPRSLPEIVGYDVSGTMQPADLVGGDYYDVVRITDTKTAFCVADAAGKGLPGALLISNLQAALKPLISEGMQPHEVCGRMNRILFDIMPVNKFVSFFYGVLDSSANRLTYCNAGHNPPLLVRSGGSVSTLKSSGAVLGHFSNWGYEQTDINIQCGDTLLLFTDGVVEACDEREKAFGEERLSELARKLAHRNAFSLRGTLLQAVSNHCGGKFQDDATLIVLRRETV